MLLSRKRSRDMGEPSALPVLRHPSVRRDEHEHERLRLQTMEALRRHNSSAGVERPARLSRARLSSQELFLSVVMEWQQTAGAPDANANADAAMSSDESEDEQKPKTADEISPTSVHNPPRELTPLRLDFSPAAPVKMIGIYTPSARQQLLRKYMAKRAKRLSQHKVRYRVRKTLANARPRVKGRFVKTVEPLTAAAVEAGSSTADAEKSETNSQSQ